jgi:thioredoxin-like negative regulator of GroEL
MQRLRSAVGIMSLVGDLGAKQASTKAKKELTQEEQAKVNAGKAKAMEIAKQRADQEARQLALKVDDLINAINISNDPKAAGEELLAGLQTQIDGAKKKAKKTLQQTLELLEQRLTS